MKTVKLMNRNDSVMTMSLNVEKLMLIQKALGVKLRAQVGVLGSSPHNRSVVAPRMATERNAKGLGRPSKTLGSDLTNAEIGAIHEFGKISKPKIPQRSFLWMPLSLYLQDEVYKKASVFNKLISFANVLDCYALLGICGENVVQYAFQTGGFGEWPALKPQTIANKGSDKILIDTAQLRKSITSRVI